MTITTRPGVATASFPSGPILRTLAEIDQPTGREEQVVGVATARVVFANYALVQHDFPALRGASPAEIDAWLIHHGGVVSVAQAAQAEVNSPIATTAAPRRAFRPPMYGRAVVMPVPGGLLDIKGAGVATGVRPARNWHQNGLLMLGAGLGSAGYQDLIHNVFRNARSELWCVPEYAILDLGFDVRLANDSSQPACVLLRRAHRRQPGGGDLPDAGSVEERVKLEIELLLRQYGITSCAAGTSIQVEQRDDGTYVGINNESLERLRPIEAQGLQLLPGYRAGAQRYEGINVQMVREHGIEPVRAQLVDFGQYLCHERFEHPLLSMGMGRPLRWSRAIGPESPHFLQPDARRRIPMAVWGTARSDELGHMPPHPGGEVWPRPYAVSFALARAFRTGELDGVGVRQQLDAMVQAAVARWRA